MSSPLEIRSVTIGDAAGSLRFELVFDRAPDFVTVDELDRNFDAFQLQLTHDTQEPFLFRDTWIDGRHIQAGQIPVYPMQLDGNFGPIAASVPYSVSVVNAGHAVSFSVPYAALSTPDSVIPPDGHASKGKGAFVWFLATFQYGLSPYPANNATGQYPALQAPENLRIKR